MKLYYALQLLQLIFSLKLVCLLKSKKAEKMLAYLSQLAHTLSS